MPSVGIRKRISSRTGRVSYQVWWLLDDGSQGANTVATKDEARGLMAQKRLEATRGTLDGRRQGRQPFSRWADQWWAVWSTDPDRSPTTLEATENRLRRHVRPWFGDRPIDTIRPTLIRHWQNQLTAKLSHESLMACRSILLRILQLAEDEGAIASNPLRKVPAPKRRADPEQLLGQTTRRALTPEEAGRLLAGFPLFWWDHVITLRGTGLRFGELAGGCAAAGSTSTAPRPCSTWSTRATRPAGSAAASNHDRKATPASGSCRSPRRWWRRSAASSRLAATPTRWSSPALDAATACPPARGRCCHGTTSAACTAAPRAGQAPTWPTSSSTAPTICGTRSRP